MVTRSPGEEQHYGKTRRESRTAEPRALAAGVSTATLDRHLATEFSTEFATHFARKETIFSGVIDERVAAFGDEAGASAATGDSLCRLAPRQARHLSGPVLPGLLRAPIANRDNGAGFQERLESHGNANLAQI